MLVKIRKLFHFVNFQSIAALIVFVAAMLIFLMEPLFAKALLPTFGGSAAVWTTSSVFFQILLLIGYSYALFLQQLNPTRQLWLHFLFCLVVLAMVVLPLFSSHLNAPQLINLLDSSLAPKTSSITRIFLLGMGSIGLSFVFLGTVSTVTQIIAVNLGSKNPYTLYRLSNAGSFVGLLLYPLVVEPLLPIKTQLVIWHYAAVLLMLVVMIALGYLLIAKKLINLNKKTQKIIPPNLKSWLLWVLMASLPVTYMLVVTEHITKGIAPFPYLWIIPLALYLISFIIGFGLIKFGAVAALASLATSLWCITSLTIGATDVITYTTQVIIFSLTVLLTGLLFHAQLYQSRPHSGILSYFYLAIAVGGVVGGFLVNFIFPVLFAGYWELPGLLIMITIIGLVIFSKSSAVYLQIFGKKYLLSAKIMTIFSIVILCCASVIKLTTSINNQLIYQDRNFYGGLRVMENDQKVALFNGSILHGAQLKKPTDSLLPLNYYSHESGIGQTIQHLQSIQPSLKVAVIGLGSGVLASYCRSEDQFDFYEINPMVIEVANKYFTFLMHCPSVKLHLGDARQVLEQSAIEEKFDIIVVDAFTDDSIPTHLLTLEATQLYLHKLNDHGIIAFHISNRYLDLEKVIANHVKEESIFAYRVLVDDTDSQIGSTSDWILVSKLADQLEGTLSNTTPLDYSKTVRWTDDFSNLLSILKFPW